MAQRAIWKGVVSFAAVRVPVKLYSAVEEPPIPFCMLHDQDRVRLRQQLLCQRDGKPVPDDEIVRGLQVDEDEYVLVSDEELEALEPEGDRSIAVDRFVARGQVDARYFDRPYHLGRDGEPEKYAALAEALDASGHYGVCRWSFRRRAYTGMLYAAHGVLNLETLLTAGEIISTKELHLEKATVSQRERETGRYLVDQLTGDFDPRRYRNEFRKELEGLIAKKMHGGKLTKRSTAKPKLTESKGLLAALEASLAGAKKGGTPGERAKSKKAKK